MLTTVALLFACLCIWLVAVKDSQSKTRYVNINDRYEEDRIELDGSVSQSFEAEQPVYAIGTVFYNTAEANGMVACHLYDDRTGNLLASAAQPASSLSDGQYSMFLFDRPCVAERFSVVFSTDAAFTSVQIGCSSENQLGETGSLTAGGELRQGTIALRISLGSIGSFSSLFFWFLSLALALLSGGMVWLLGKKTISVTRLFFFAALILGLLYNIVLPPYSSPDEMFHINQAFNNSSVILGGVERSRIVWGENFKRPSDYNELVQNKDTTVFTYREIAENLFTASPDAASDTAQFHQEEVGGFNLLYLFSSLGVLLGRLLGLGFVPTLMLGRLFNFAFYLTLTTWAVRITPVARSCFAVVALLPMSLHLAMSFNRDCVLLALAFCYTALCFHYAYGENLSAPLSWKQHVPLGLLGAFLAPSKVVYLPLCFLFLIIPGERFGEKKRARICRLSLAACAVIPYLLTSSAFGVAFSFVRDLFSTPGAVQVPDTVNPDSITYGVPYILGHIKQTIELVIRTYVENSSFYLRSLLGDSLGYFSISVDPIWSMGLGALVLLSVFDSAHSKNLRPGSRLFGFFLTAVVFALVTLGCVLWTPTHYTKIYGIQGRYFLPAIPLLLACLKPKNLSLNRDLSRALICGICLVQTGVLLNVFLVILAR